MYIYIYTERERRDHMYDISIITCCSCSCSSLGEVRWFVGSLLPSRTAWHLTLNNANNNLVSTCIYITHYTYTL